MKINVYALTLLIIALGLFSPLAAAEEEASLVEAKTQPELLADVSSGKLSGFMVILSEQADLSSVAKFNGKRERGRFVYEKLRETASRTQPPVIEELVSRGFRVTPYFISNEIAVGAPEGGVLSTKEAISILAKRPDVARILHPGKPFIAGAPRISAESSSERPVGWNIRAIGATKLHRRGKRGQGIVVGIVDSGAQATHEALSGTYRGRNSSHDYNWFDPTLERTLEPTDTNGHGTHTTGIIAGSAPGMPVGVAPEAEWIHCRGLGPGSSRETVLSCLQFFLAPTDVNGENPDPDLAPDITNNSYICPFCELENAFASLNAAGIISVSASSNFGPTCGSLFDPGTYKEVLTVGAMEGGKRSRIADFSSRGMEGDSFVKPELVAPGLLILSSTLDNQYEELSGTSEAAPHVSGAIALLWSARPALRGKIRLTRRRLIQSAVKRRTGLCSESRTSPNPVFGFGFLDIAAARRRPAE